MMQLNDTITVGEAASKYLMQVGANVETQTELNRFVRWAGPSRRLSQLSSHEVAGYAEQLGTTTTDIMRKLDPVKQFLDHAKKEGAVTIYSSAQTEDMNIVIAAFEKNMESKSGSGAAVRKTSCNAP